MREIIFKYWFLFFGLLLQQQQSNAQTFHNLTFQQSCDTSKTGLCYWDLSWGGKGAVMQKIMDGIHCLGITGKVENAVGFTEQSALYDTANGMSIITVSAFIKSDSIVGKGAGLNIGLYDVNGTLIASKDMGGFYSLDWIRGTSDWKQYSISLIATSATHKIKIGAIVFGKGISYFKDYTATITPLEDRAPSALAIQFIGDACDTIKLNSLVRDSLDMEQLQKTALQIAGDATTYPECYLAINFLLESLRPFGDEHSFFMSPEELKNWENEGSEISKIEFPAFKIVDQCGYILVPPFHGGNQKQILAFADSLQNGIRQLVKVKVKGWVVDLRQNTGGNMSPMVAGLGPLFSDEKLGSLIDVNGKANSWYYQSGKYYWDNDPGWAVSKPYKLKHKSPIAVLTGGQTGSSGEAVTVSFIGNAKTKLFGQPTWGLTTGNGNFSLKDGSEIFLASTIYADRNGKTYDARIDPDFLVDDDQTGGKDLVLQAAMEWILSLQ